MSEPSAEALECTEVIVAKLGKISPEDKCLIARIIDSELQLPQRNAALLLAQGVVDVWSRQSGRVFESMGKENPRAEAIQESIHLLCEALTRIKK